MLIFFIWLNLFWHSDKNFCFYAEVNFWDFVSSGWTIFGSGYENCPEFAIEWERLDSVLKKSRPRYISAQKIATLFDALDEREIAR